MPFRGPVDTIPVCYFYSKPPEQPWAIVTFPGARKKQDISVVLGELHGGTQIEDNVQGLGPTTSLLDKQPVNIWTHSHFPFSL